MGKQSVLFQVVADGLGDGFTIFLLFKFADAENIAKVLNGGGHFCGQRVQCLV